MAVDMQVLVENRLSPLFSLDPTLQNIIPSEITAQIALQGWSLAAIDDQKAVYLSLLTTRALVPRLLLKFSIGVKRAKGGPAEAEYMDAIKFLEALREELTVQLRAAAAEADPVDVDVVSDTTPWPSVGVVSW